MLKFQWQIEQLHLCKKRKEKKKKKNQMRTLSPLYLAAKQQRAKLPAASAWFRLLNYSSCDCWVPPLPPWLKPDVLRVIYSYVSLTFPLIALIECIWEHLELMIALSTGGGRPAGFSFIQTDDDLSFSCHTSLSFFIVICPVGVIVNISKTHGIKASPFNHLYHTLKMILISAPI